MPQSQYYSTLRLFGLFKLCTNATVEGGVGRRPLASTSFIPEGLRLRCSPVSGLFVNVCRKPLSTYIAAPMGSEAAPREVEQGAGGELHGPDVSNGAVSEDSRGINESLQQTPAQAEAEVDDDEEDDEEEDDEEAEIQLGFAEEVERDDDGLMALEGGNWRDWDGGKIGGKPVRTWTLRECLSGRSCMPFRCAASWCLTSCVALLQIWLDPELVPTSDELSCPSCQDPLSFILQVMNERRSWLCAW